MGKLSSAMENLVEAIRSAADARHSGLGELRTGTRATLGRRRRERRDSAAGNKQSVQQQVAAIREAAGELRHSARTALNQIASDVRAATQLWSMAAEPAPRAAPPPPAAPAPSVPEQQPSSAPERRRVLRIIRAHAEGIRLIDIGNELGVDWRSLIAVTRSLVEEGKIEKIENLYCAVEN